MTRLISMRSGWGVVSPEGYFDGTLDGEAEERLDAIQWKADEQSFPINGFLERYYQPALFGRLMAEKEIQKPEESPPDISEKGFLPPPEVKITDPKPNSQASDKTVSVTVKGSDRKGGISEIRLFHNEKAVHDDKAERKVEKAEEIKTYDVMLLNGENRFRAVGFSDDRIEGKSDEITVSYHEPEPPKPALHVVVIGINQYKNPRWNLDFSLMDAKGVLSYFTESYINLFAKLKIYELLDQNATGDAIDGVLKSLQDIPPQDTAVIFFAGHGDTVKDEWYFIPYELTDPEKTESLKKQGIASSVLQLYIVQSHAKQIFLLIDSCKSGAVLDTFSDYDSKRSFTLLSYKSGIHIAAASAKDQVTYELPTLGHGIFTYALLQGLEGKADIKPSDGNISVEELLCYIRQEMPVIISMYNKKAPQWRKIPAQTPVVNSRGTDFILAIKK